MFVERVERIERAYCDDFYYWVKSLKDALGDRNVSVLGEGDCGKLIINCASQETASKIRAFAGALHKLHLGLDGAIVYALTPEGDYYQFAEFEFEFDFDTGELIDFV